MANSLPYGFWNLENVLDRRINEVPIQEITTAIDQSLAEHTRQLDTLNNIFVRRVNSHKTKFRSPSNERLQPLDSIGRALPTQGGDSYDVGFPLQAAGTAWGYDRITRIKMTVRDVAEALNQKQIADKRWVRDHILGALYAADSWTFADKEHGNLTIESLADGDSVTYNIRTGHDAAATDDHILAQAAAIADAANPFDDIYTELMEHPENSGDVVVFAPTNLKSSIEGLATFKEYMDPEITPGNASDRLTGRLNIPVPGEVIGRVDKCWIVEWASLPSDYLIAVATEGERAVGERVHPEAELQGFRRIGSREDVPYFEDQYQRHAGYGIWNRVGALVMRIGNGTYAVPTGYDVPMR